jgi:hypothetical protein
VGRHHRRRRRRRRTSYVVVVVELDGARGVRGKDAVLKSANNAPQKK